MTRETPPNVDVVSATSKLTRGGWSRQKPSQERELLLRNDATEAEVMKSSRPNIYWSKSTDCRVISALVKVMQLIRLTKIKNNHL